MSVKTRIGFNKEEIDTWIPELLKENIFALTVHLRTKKELSLVPAHWELMSEVITLRNKIAPSTLIIGNGDVESVEDAKEKALKYGCDGIMIGRAVFGNPWFFSSKKNSLPEIREKLNVLIEHSKLFEKDLGKDKNFAVMKKHFKAYVSGFEGAKELRVKLMETNNSREVEKIINNFLK